MKQRGFLILILLFILTILSCSTKSPITNQSIEIAKSGCCSSHGGVCGCVDGRVKCCDGTLSPTCTCDE